MNLDLAGLLLQLCMYIPGTGEVFGGLEVPAGANDGEELLHALGREHCDILEQLSAIRGPWALVYWHAATRTLWFGRDAIGG